MEEFKKGLKRKRREKRSKKDQGKRDKYGGTRGGLRRDREIKEGRGGVKRYSERDKYRGTRIEFKKGT